MYESAFKSTNDEHLGVINSKKYLGDFYSFSY